MKKDSKNAQLENQAAQTPVAVTCIPASRIVCSPFNPRRYRTDEDMQELSASIRLHGLLQPITVRAKGETFEIVCGERRFRASLMAGLDAVPSIVKDYTDLQAMEVCILENLQRKNISPIEEAAAFGQLYELRGYGIETLATEFGKSEKYIRGRLQLRNLIEEAAQLVVLGELSIANALELSRYNQEIQADIYTEHLASDDSYSWKELSAAAFRDRLEHNYCNSLSNYSFDHSACETCRYNSAVYDLFATDKCGNCQNAACLKEKQLEHILNATIEKVETAKEDTAIYLHPSSGTTKSLREKLDEKGYEIVDACPQYYPNPPQRPVPADYPTKEALDKAMKTHWENMAEYTEKMEDISRKAAEGSIQRMIDVNGTRPVACYRVLTQDGRKAEDPIEQLRKKDRRNREIAIERTVEELVKFLREAEVSKAPFTDREQDMLYFIMLPSLKREHLKDLGFKDSLTLSSAQVYNLLPRLTEEQKSIIRRDFIVSHLSETNMTGKRSELLAEFATLHYPEQTAAIQMQYYDAYEKRHEHIMERIRILEENQPPVAAGEDIFYEEIEAAPLYNGLPVTTFEGELADIA
jgi:ParB family chromosome partitioning protein